MQQVSKPPVWYVFFYVFGVPESIGAVLER